MEIKKICCDLQENIVRWRRHFHRYPETGAEVPETAGFLAHALTEAGLIVNHNMGGHGLTALLEGVQPGPCLAIRSDMDALNLEEETGLPFASEIPGRMHACGHDAHMAIALGAASALSQIRKQLKGSVKFIFQPAEESFGGAQKMIEAGALEQPKVDAITGLHVGGIWEGFRPGTVGYRFGPMFASRDHVEITITGKGGHGAMPHQGIDTITTACQAVCTAQSIISQEISPQEPAVLTFGIIQGGTYYNIIAEKTYLEGTVRTLGEKTRNFLAERIPQVFEDVTRSRRADIYTRYTYSYPVLVNDPGFTEFFSHTAKNLLGSENVIQIEEPTMGSEDMAYFLKEVPGTFFFLSTRNPEKGIIYPHHNPRFDVDEDVLWIGSALLAQTAWSWLENNREGR